MITAAVIFAEAAVLYEGLNAVQSQSYGPEARGGASRSDVIISDSEIHFPKVIQPNILVCLTQEAYNKYSGLIRPGGLLLTDEHYVKRQKKVDARQVGLHMHKKVLKELGNPVVLNICMLGALNGLTRLIKKESLMEVLKKRLPPKLLPMNEQALELGIKMVRGHKKSLY